MNSTSKCWLIANLEIITFGIAAAITGLAAIVHRAKILPLLNEDAGEIIFFFLFSCTLFHPTRKLCFGIIKYFGLTLAHVLYSVLVLKFSSNAHETVIAVWITWAIFVASSSIGGWTAYNSNQNIDEVVSLRMLYKNSSVDLFEITRKYSINRFCVISFSLSAFIYWMIFLRMYIINQCKYLI